MNNLRVSDMHGFLADAAHRVVIHDTEKLKERMNHSESKETTNESRMNLVEFYAESRYGELKPGLGSVIGSFVQSLIHDLKSRL